jgi:hypothetical protein
MIEQPTSDGLSRCACGATWDPALQAHRHCTLPDDLLSRMKEQIHLRRGCPSGSFITVTANEMNALVECAEAAIEYREARGLAVEHAYLRLRTATEELEAL